MPELEAGTRYELWRNGAPLPVFSQGRASTENVSEAHAEWERQRISGRPGVLLEITVRVLRDRP